VSRLAATAALAIAVAACTDTTQSTDTVAALDDMAYVRDVHPIIEARCGTLDCHGAANQPLRVFAETGLRSADNLRNQLITSDELIANVRALAAIDPGADPADNQIVSKPLAQAAGGLFHQGGEIWPDRQDPQYLCVLGWLAGTSDDAAVAAACVTAAEQVALPPP
jgi:hypothetical protein